MNYFEMELIKDKLKSHFDTKLERFRVFHKRGVQVEGWVKGELLYLFESMLSQGNILKYDREVVISNNSRAKCDFFFETDEGRNWLELKFWIMMQKGKRYPPKWYFQQNNCLYNDYQKLFSAPKNDKKWAMVFCVNNPGQEHWEEGLRKFQDHFMVEQVPVCKTQEFENEYYFELFQIVS